MLSFEIKVKLPWEKALVLKFTTKESCSLERKKVKSLWIKSPWSHGVVCSFDLPTLQQPQRVQQRSEEVTDERLTCQY